MTTFAAPPVGKVVHIRPGYGYWDVTTYPLGGDFHRNGQTPLAVTVEQTFKPQKGCDTVGKTEAGRRIVFGYRDVTEEGEAERKADLHFAANLGNMSIDEVENAYRQGRVSEEDVVQFLRKWNATPGRFTQAVLSDGAIRNFDPEEDKGQVAAYRHLKDKFNLQLPDKKAAFSAAEMFGTGDTK